MYVSIKKGGDVSEKRSCQGKNIAKFNEQNAQFGQKHMQECSGGSILLPQPGLAIG